jgi:hypothetical protein
MTTTPSLERRTVHAAEAEGRDARAPHRLQVAVPARAADERQAALGARAEPAPQLGHVAGEDAAGLDQEAGRGVPARAGVPRTRSRRSGRTTRHRRPHAASSISKPEKADRAHRTTRGLQQLEAEMLTKEAKIHFDVPTSPFVDDVNSEADVFVTKELRAAFNALYYTAKHAGITALICESGGGKSVLRRWLDDTIRDAPGADPHPRAAGRRQAHAHRRPDLRGDHPRPQPGRDDSRLARAARAQAARHARGVEGRGQRQRAPDRGGPRPLRPTRSST